MIRSPRSRAISATLPLSHPSFSFSLPLHLHHLYSAAPPSSTAPPFIAPPRPAYPFSPPSQALLASLSRQMPPHPHPRPFFGRLVLTQFRKWQSEQKDRQTMYKV